MTQSPTPPPETHPGVRCERCDGTGDINVIVDVSGVKWGDMCPACHGTGKQRG